MRLLIALAVFVCRWWMVYGHCPFPGVTAYAWPISTKLHLANGIEEGDFVEYACPWTDAFDWFPLFLESPFKLTCRSDGTWDNPLPACGNSFIYFHTYQVNL